MERWLGVCIETSKKNGEFIITIGDSDTGMSMQETLPYSPDEHPEFDRLVGNEIYSWITLMMDEEEDDEDA